MNVIDTIKNAARTVWHNKVLWVFGLFLGAGASFSYKSDADGAPTWLPYALAALAVLAPVMLVLHVASEAALIEGVAVARDGRKVSFGEGLRSGLRHFWRVAGVKLAAVLGVLACIVLIGLPVAAVFFGKLPWWTAAIASGGLTLAAVPVLLTGYFVYMYALRFVVLRGRGVRDSVRDSVDYLHGRLEQSIVLLISEGIGQMVAAVCVFAVLIVPALLVGGGLWLASGQWLVGLIAAGVLVTPFAAAATGAIGSFRSAVWTQGFLANQG